MYIFAHIQFLILSYFYKTPSTGNQRIVEEDTLQDKCFFFSRRSCVNIGSLVFKKKISFHIGTYAAKN